MKTIIDISQLHPLILLIIIILAVFVRYRVERIIARIFKSFRFKRIGIQIFTKSILMIAFNGIILAVFGLFEKEIIAFENIQTGLILIGIGVSVAVLVAILTYKAIKAGFGTGYGEMIRTSRLDKVLLLLTFILLIGLTEDIFFIGFVQKTLTPHFGWGVIIIYLVIFVGYHYANVIGGIETKKEFLGTIPVRLILGVLLSISFYMTNSLVYGLIIHNIVDTISYIALVLAHIGDNGD